ncbi:MAG: N-acetyltransferase [Pseudomonadota bacterium]
MVEIAIRPATHNDVDILSVVGAGTFLESFADTLPGPDIALHCQNEHSAEAYAKILRSGARAWLACIANTGAVIGYALNTAPNIPIARTSGDIELKRIYLLSKYQGVGAGRALMKAAIKDASERRAERLILGVYCNNGNAMGFYRAMGFRTIGTRRFTVGTGTYEDLVFALEL